MNGAKLHEKVHNIVWGDAEKRPMGPEVPMINQERAYTSPIWYIP